MVFINMAQNYSIILYFAKKNHIISSFFYPNIACMFCPTNTINRQLCPKNIKGDPWAAFDLLNRKSLLFAKLHAHEIEYGGVFVELLDVLVNSHVVKALSK